MVVTSLRRWSRAPAMSPRLWTEDEASGEWLKALKSTLAEVHSGVVELSGGQTLIEIHGPHAIDTLAKGTPIDLHPWHFGAGQCTRTVLAKTTAFVRVVEPGQAFEIVVRRSFADHLWRWLRDAADEYGCTVEQPETASQQILKTAWSGWPNH